MSGKEQAAARKADTTDEEPAPSEPSDSESSAAQNLEEDGAAATERAHRNSEAMQWLDESRLGMAYERSTTSLRRLMAAQEEARRTREELRAASRQKDPAFQSETELERFKHLVCRRFGTLTRGWRTAIDIRAEHQIGFINFARALRHIGFSSNAKAMWTELTQGRARLTLDDLDGESAQALRNFSERFKEEFDEGLAIILERSDSGQITRKDFFAECEGLDAENVNLTQVFEALEMTKGFLRVSDCKWLESYIAWHQAGGRKRPPRHAAAAGTASKSSTKVDYSDVLLAQRGKQALKEFKAKLQHKYGSVLAAWRKKLDPEGTGSLTEEEMEYRVTLTGFDGDFSDLWQELTDGVKDAVTLHDLEPAAEEARLEFVKACVARFGSLPIAIKSMQAERTPLATANEFFLFCNELNFKKNRKMLFNYLDSDGVGEVLVTDVDPENAAGFADDVIDDARDRLATLKDQPDTAGDKSSKDVVKQEYKPVQIGHDALVRFLEEKFKSPVQAWKKVFDCRGRGEISRAEFEKACMAVGFTGSVKTVCKELELEGDDDKVRLRDVAPGVGEDCQEFKRLARRHHDGVVRAMADYLETPNLNKVKMNVEEFTDFCHHLGYAGSAKTLFAHLDLMQKGTLHHKNLKWFEDGKDPDRAIMKALSKLAKKRWETWHQKQKEAQAPRAEAAKVQDKSIQAAREKRSTANTDKDDKEEFLRQMAAEYGSVARAWVVAMDPDGNGSVTAQEWLNGVQRAGLIDPATSTSEDYDHYDRLFEVFLSDVDEGRVFFGDWDPVTVELMDKVKKALKTRYGSLKQAFWCLDPEGTGRISVDAFKWAMVECKCQEAVYRVALYLDPQDEGEIELANIDERAANKAQRAALKELQAGRRKYGSDWRPKAVLEAMDTDAEAKEANREERQRQAAQQLIVELKRRLCRKHGTVTKAWHVVFECSHDGEVDYPFFAHVCKSVGLDKNSKAAWDLLVDGQRRLTLLSLEPRLQEDLNGLRSGLQDRFGSFDAAFEYAMQHHVLPDVPGQVPRYKNEGRCYLDMGGFKQICFECRFRGNEGRIFEYLDFEHAGRIPLDLIDEDAWARIWSRLNTEYLEKVAAMKLAKKLSGDGDSASDGEEDATAAEISGDASPKAHSDITFPVNSVESAGGRAVVKDPLQAFREYLLRRFGNTWAAWRSVIDRRGRVLLNKVQFLNGVNSCGYSGSPTPLWAAVLAARQGGDSEEPPSPFVSFRDLDAEAFARMVKFRRFCVRRLGGLAAAFTTEEELARAAQPEQPPAKPSLTLNKAAFAQVCQHIHYKQPELLFELLDVNRIGSLQWKDVRFLEEDWKWTPKTVTPVLRKLPATPPVPEADHTHRATGTGHLAMSLKPARVVPQKSPSAPTLPRPLIRPEWDTRHHVPARMLDPSVELVQGICAAGRHKLEKLQEKIAQALVDEPTSEWLAQHGPANLPDPPQCDYITADDIKRRQMEKSMKVRQGFASSMIAVTRGTELHAHF